MNDIDIKNIKKELRKRSVSEYDFETGGDLTKGNLTCATTEELKQLVNEYSNNKKTITGEKIKKITDEIFEKYAEGNDNMIVLGACNYYDEDRHASLVEEPLKEINFDGFGHNYNKLAYPIGRDHDNYEELMKDVQKIIDLMPDLGLSDIEKYWDNNNGAINEIWYGVHAITKDYQIVAFVIRDDGMLCDKDSFESFYNSILYKL